MLQKEKSSWSKMYMKDFGDIGCSVTLIKLTENWF